MTYLLDAHWVISFLNGRANAVALVSQLADESLAVSVITWGEICEGLLSRPDPEGHIAQLNEFVSDVDLIVPDTQIARHYAEIRSYLRARGQLIPDNDTWLAATALAYDFTVVSRDRHFQRIPRLKVYHEE